MKTMRELLLEHFELSVRNAIFEGGIPRMIQVATDEYEKLLNQVEPEEDLLLASPAKEQT